MRFSLIIFSIVLLFSCSTKTEINTSKPLSLNYTPNIITLVKGNIESSVIPEVDDGGEALSSFQFVQTINGITINSMNGIITVNSTVAIGSYELDIILKNANGSTVFENAFIVHIVASLTKPVSLSYNPSTISLFSTTSKNSSSPSINNGGSAITNIRLLGKIPNGITINSATGVVSISNSVGIGTYVLSFEVSNALGSTTFSNKLTVQVIDISNAITFNNDILPLIEGKCQPCHTPNGDNRNYTVYSTAKARAASIVIRTANGTMPRNGANGGLSQAQKELFAQWVEDGTLE